MPSSTLIDEDDIGIYTEEAIKRFIIIDEDSTNRGFKDMRRDYVVLMKRQCIFDKWLDKANADLEKRKLKKKKVTKK